MMLAGRTWVKARGWLLAVAIAALIAGLLPISAAVVISPDQLGHGYVSSLPPCPARVAGGSCALCGMSHAFSAMARGRFAEATRFNSHGPGLFIFCLTLATLGAAGLASNWSAIRPERRDPDAGPTGRDAPVSVHSNSERLP